MSALVEGDRVWWKDEAWVITRVWDTNVAGEGLRADLESLERIEVSDLGASVNVTDLDGRIGEAEEAINEPTS